MYMIMTGLFKRVVFKLKGEKEIWRIQLSEFAELKTVMNSCFLKIKTIGKNLLQRTRGKVKFCCEKEEYHHYQFLDCFNCLKKLRTEERNLIQDDLLAVALRSSGIVISVHS